jgi:hypothetical protein
MPEDDDDKIVFHPLSQNLNPFLVGTPFGIPIVEFL